MLFKKILEYVKIKRQVIILMIAVLNTVIGASTPILYGTIIDKVLINREFSSFVQFVLIYLGLIVSEIILGYIQNCIVVKTGEEVALQLRRQIYQKINSLDYSSKNKYGIGNIVSLFNSDIFQVTNFMSRFVYDIVLQIVTIVVIIVMMFAMNAKLTTIVLLFIPIFFLFFLRIGKATQFTVTKRQEFFVKINARLQEDIKGNSFLQIRECVRYRHHKMDEMFSEFLQVNYHFSKLSGLVNQLGTLFASFADVLVLAFGGYLFMHSNLSIGIIIAFEAYVAHLFSPILSLVSLNQIAHIAKPSLKRIFEFLNLESSTKQCLGTVEIKDIVSDIHFEDVSFAYDSENVLEHFNLTIHPNTLHFLVGESGCGKSTICALLAKMMPVKEGCILVNLKNINDYTIDSIRQHIYYLHQESIIYNCSLRQNIEMGQSYKESEILNVLEQVCLTKIGDKPIDLDMPIDANGDSLSGGEKRRIVLARALIRKYDVYILDEPTSGLDPITAKKLILNLKQQTKYRTFVIVSHNQEDFMLADMISVIAHGGLAMEGTYQQLTDQASFIEIVQSIKNTEII